PPPCVDCVQAATLTIECSGSVSLSSEVLTFIISDPVTLSGCSPVLSNEIFSVTIDCATLNLGIP
ncbi:MAG: hypothetical protein KC940_10885, partial [Candidatus Omnitrophica bacterium]|nr:hypothetical protein [Candidatus Omnitrophota bacterium]